MAKTSIGLGQFSGKVGGVVFSVTAGQQVARAYQPVVSNPKSEGQRIQRAKANLVGQLSRITPWQILTGLGTNKRNRRSRFLRIALQRTTAGAAAGDPTTINAKLLAQDFVFSEGAVVPVMRVGSVVPTANEVSVTLVRSATAAVHDWDSYGALVVVTLATSDNVYESVVYRFVNASEFPSDGTGAFTFSIPHAQEGAHVANTYIAPFKTTDGTSLRARANELFGTSADFNASMVYNPSALPVVWGSSVFMSSATYTPA